MTLSVYREWASVAVVPGDIFRGVRVTEIPDGLDNETAVSEMQTLLTEIARALVDDTQAVRIETLTSPDSVVLRLHVAASDIGKVIGKQGRTARSLRTILGAASMKLQRRFSLDIVEAPNTAS
jgi:predicted RNA-binding protein YlqC (UPF0109 family)